MKNLKVKVTKTGRISIQTGKLQYVHRISLGEVLAIIVDSLILFAIFWVA